MSFLNREKRIPADLLKGFGEAIFLLAKEALMVPELMFKIAKPTDLIEINFSNYKQE